MADEPAGPGRLESIAAGVAGVAFAAGAILLRRATLVPPGIFDGAAVILASWGSSLAIQRAWGKATATIARGVGGAIGALLMAAALVPPYDHAALPVAAWVLGAACLQASTRTRPLRLALAGAGALLLAVGVALAWRGASAWPEPARLRWAILAAAALGALALTLRALAARRWPKLAPSPVGVLLAAALAASYLAYRPLVAASVANLPLYEWTLGVGAAGLLLGRLRSSARDAAVAEAWTGEGRKHRADTAPAYDARQTMLAIPIQRYLDTGQGFEDYRAAMLRASPASGPFRKTLQGAQPVPGRGRGAKAARRERLATHEALMELLR